MKLGKYDKWLASFRDAWQADRFLKKEAKRLTALGLGGRYGLFVNTDSQGHHVYIRDNG